MAEPAIEAEGLSKCYRRHAHARDRFVEWLTLGRAARAAEHWAVRDATFSCARGSSLGLCGRNGAGKSTLLRVVTGATAPSAGRYRTRGRVASLLELGAGFHPDFTGRENVVQSGVLCGASCREVRARMPAIVEFAGIGAAIDAPVRTYSSGMAMRLAFATAILFEPDVLVLDEVLAVGDQTFQKKCIDHVFALRARGATIVLTSHSLYDLRQVCDEALWLEEGRIRASGECGTVVAAYSAFEHERARSSAQGTRDENDPRVVDARVVRSGTLEPVSTIQTGDSVDVRVEWLNPRGGQIHLGISFTRQDQTLVAAAGTHFDGLTLHGKVGTAVLSLPDVALLSGSFLVIVHLFDGHGVHRYEERALDERLIVHNPSREVGLVRLAHAWRCENATAPRRGTAQEAAA
jgi:ABC-type polysaccharide/polyol phosphate transport system ATPase subunit